MASASNFRMSLRRHNVIYKRATFLRTKASAKWSDTATTLSRVTPRIQIRAQFRLLQVKAMFKQLMNLMIWTWILRLQTASRNEFPCKNSCLHIKEHYVLNGDHRKVTYIYKANFSIVHKNVIISSYSGIWSIKSIMHVSVLMNSVNLLHLISFPQLVK